MKAMQYTLDQLNRISTDAFVAALSGIFEHSPWVAEVAAEQRPFASIDALHRTMSNAVETAGEAKQLALINAHPELAGKAAVRGELTAESTREQSGAGLAQCTQEEFDRLRGAERARIARSSAFRSFSRCAAMTATASSPTSKRA